MSKRDIIAVTTLAAHLAFKAEPGWGFASRCASDAMALQRLGRSAMNALDRLSASEAGKSPHAYSAADLEERWEQIQEDADEVLRPYGLRAECRDEPFSAECLFIMGLPSNTKDCGEGYAI